MAPFDLRFRAEDLCAPSAFLFDRVAFWLDLVIPLHPGVTFSDWLGDAADRSILPLIRSPTGRGNGRTLRFDEDAHVGGKLTATFRPSGPDRRASVRVRGVVTLNPTRWMGDHGDTSAAVLQAMSDVYLLTRVQRPERALDGNDNLLPSLRGQGAPTLDPRVETSLNQLLGIYARAVERHLSLRFHCIQEQGSGCVALVRPSEAESYVEWWSETAVLDVEGIGRALRALSRSSEMTFYELRRLGMSQEQRGASAKIDLNETTTAIFYAKEEDRIRCEIRFKPCSSHLPQVDQRMQPDQHRVECFMRLRERASQYALPLINALREYSTIVGAPADLMSLITEVHSAADGDARLARAILSHLLTQGGVAFSQEREPAFGQAVEVLKARGIVGVVRTRIRDNPATRIPHYVLLAPYGAAAELFAAAIDVVSNSK